VGVRSYTLAGLLTATALLAWLLWPARRPSVLLISIDSLRPDFLSCYGGRHAQTPHIDAVAAAGVSFTQAIADVPWERASVASVLTGRYATTHHVRSFFDRLPETSATMAERFAAAGYRTGAVVSDFDLDHIFLLDRGFQTYDDRYTVPVHITSHERPVHLASLFYGDVAQDRGFRRRKLMADSLREDAQVTNAAIGWLRRVGLQPFFLWVHYFGPHRRWQSGTELDEVLAAYQPAVQRVDAEIGRLLGVLNEMQLDRNTIIVVHADRGTSLLDHGELSPGTDLYDTSLRVPLIMYWRGRLPAGVRNGAMVRLIDVLPTLTELSGLPPLASPDGRSLVGLLRGSEPTPKAEAYCETYLPATAAASKTASGPDGRPVHFGFVRRGIRTERWKYIRSDPSALIDVAAPAELPESWRPAMMSEELFDLSQDPGEQHNLIDSDPTTAATLRRALDRYVQGRTR
jgi:arylsulfatase A-like enzyme